jgi:pimeloyl-ACP methyl ester carboxylesterase
MNAPTDSFAVSLRDGRRLAYRCAGPPDGMLVLYLHGAIGSPQTVCPELEAVVAELGVRYVMVSRPGFGGSDPLAGRTMLRFADDVAQLADALGHERFAVVGVSTGGPYALACAMSYPSASPPPRL